MTPPDLRAPLPNAPTVIDTFPPLRNNGRMAGALNFLDWDDTGAVTPVVLLPGQLPRRQPQAHSPERELFRAILRSAAEDLSSANPTIRCEAVRWFKFPDLDCPVSLRSCCDALDLPRPHSLARRALSTVTR
jgi:hypothetical protein